MDEDSSVASNFTEELLVIISGWRPVNLWGALQSADLISTIISSHMPVKMYMYATEWQLEMIKRTVVLFVLVIQPIFYYIIYILIGAIWSIKQRQWLSKQTIEFVLSPVPQRPCLIACTPMAFLACGPNNWGDTTGSTDSVCLQSSDIRAPEPVLHPFCPLIPSFYTHWVRKEQEKGVYDAAIQAAVS